MKQDEPKIEISFDHVSFSYGNISVLKDISFQIPVGEFVGVIGPNGAGKTTALKLMIGVLTADSGSVQIAGSVPNEAIQKSFIGYVPQHAAQKELTFPATVEEVVASGCEFTTRNAHEIQHRVSSALEACSISKLRHQLITNLSGGQRQRALIARAIALEPRILLLDEPEAGVDTASEKEFYALLKEINSTKKTTIVMISHNIDAISEVVSSIVCINRNMTCHIESKDFHENETLRRLYEGESHIHHHH